MTPRLAAAAALLAVCTLSAQTLTWDGDTSPGISNVSANWDAANVWFDGANNVSFSDGANVVFTAMGNQGYQVFTGTTGPYTVASMVFDTISANASFSIQLGQSGNAPQITLNGAASTAAGTTGIVVLHSQFDGAGAFTIGGGEFRLINNANTFSGGVTLNGGTLRVGNGNGSGNPQTSGSLGSGTFTINGGTIHQAQGNGRTQAVPGTINAGFTFTSAAGGGLTIGGTTAAPVNIGNAVRTIQIAQNLDGTGANSVFGLRNLYGGSNSGIVKNGAGVLLIESRKTPDFNFTGTFTLNGGELRLSAVNAAATATNPTTGDIGVTRIDVAAGAVLRIQANETLNRAATVTLNGGSFVSRNHLGSSRRSGFETFQISGACTIDIGSGILLASSGAAGVLSLRVGDGGTLGGNGTLRMATGLPDSIDEVATEPTLRPSYFLNGETFFNDVVDADVTLGIGSVAVGTISPGTPDALDSTIGTLSLGNLTWNGAENPGIGQMAFNLASGNQSDRIVLSGSLIRGTWTWYTFDFLESAPGPGTYTLIEAASIDEAFNLPLFQYVNLSLAAGESAEFQISGGNLLLVITGTGGSLYDDWADLYGLSGDDAAPDADPDRDGVPNLIEYALDGDPSDPASAPRPVVDLDADKVTISFNRIADPDLVYNVWASDDLADWGVAPIWSSTGASNVAGPVTVEDTVTLGAGVRRFLKLEVLLP